MVHRLAEEGGAGDGADAHFFGEFLAEFQVVGAAEFRDVKHYVVSALRDVVDKADLVKALQEEIPLVGVDAAQLPVVVVAELKTGDDGLLQRRGGADGEEVVDFFDPLRDLGRRDGIAQPPSGDGIGLRERAAADGALPHPREGGDVDMLVRFVDDMFVHLIGDHIGVVPLDDVRDLQKLLPGKDLAAGIGGIAEDQRLRALPERVLQDLRIVAVVRRRQRDVDRDGAGENGIRPVVFIKGGEDRNAVAGVRDGHHRRHHGLRAAAGHDDLRVRIDGKSHVLRLLFGQRLPQILRAPGDGVLMHVLVLHLAEAVQDGLRRIKIREALGQVDGPELVGDPGHPPDHGVCKGIGAM